MSDRKLIVIEFNELCPPLLDRWMSAGKLPNFSRFFDDASVFTTTADAEPPALEPWIQWYSLHTGIPYQQHKVFTLTDGPLADLEDIWGVLTKNKLRVGNFSSMNARGFDKPGSVFLPDPWCKSQPASPPDLDTFYRFVSAQVQEYSNPSVGSGARAAIDFVLFMLRRGLQMKTVSAVIRQLINEKTSKTPERWRRAPLQDRMQFDVFRHYFLRNNLDFATFFSNSTAHYQHSYWRHMEPEKFSIKPDADERAVYKDAILYGYQCMDALLEEFFELEEKTGATLVLATALSQQPFLKREDSGGQHFYRLRNVNRFLNHMDIRPTAIEPVMTHQYKVRFSTAGHASDAVKRIESVMIAGKPAFYARVDDETDVFFACGIGNQLDDSAEIIFSDSGSKAGFSEWLYQIEGIKSGCHHPDGVFWIKNGTHAVHTEKISLTDVFPTILDFFGLNVPNASRQGQSVLRRASGSFQT